MTASAQSQRQRAIEPSPALRSALRIQISEFPVILFQFNLQIYGRYCHTFEEILIFIILSVYYFQTIYNLNQTHY